jgi:two-component system OmpR family response regulator
MTVMLLEDETMLQSAIKEYLEETGYIVDTTHDGLKAFELVKENSYDLLILDINTPSLDGLSLLEKLQQEKYYIPTIFISAITQIEQISRAYELGCYDYLKKPFHLRELTLHIDRLLQMAEVSSKSCLKLSKMYVYDIKKERLFFDRQEQKLTRKQLQIIHTLCLNVSKVVDFDMLREYAWDGHYVDSATIRAEMHRVRSVLKEELIETVKGVGYILHKRV